MAYIADLLKIKCPSCDKYTIADKHDCGCIMGKCEYCNVDFEITDECKN